MRTTCHSVPTESGAPRRASHRFVEPSRCLFSRSMVPPARVDDSMLTAQGAMLRRYTARKRPPKDGGTDTLSGKSAQYATSRAEECQCRWRQEDLGTDSTPSCAVAHRYLFGNVKMDSAQSANEVSVLPKCRVRCLHPLCRPIADFQLSRSIRTLVGAKADCRDPRLPCHNDFWPVRGILLTTEARRTRREETTNLTNRTNARIGGSYSDGGVIWG